MVSTRLTANSRLICRTSARRRLWHEANLPREIANQLWNGNVDDIIFSAQPLQVKDRCIVVRHDWNEQPFIMKRHVWGGIRRTLRMLLREPSAKKTFGLGQHLADHGIPTPRPRACVELKMGPFGYRSYLLTDFVAGINLHEFVQQGQPSNDHLRNIASQIASIWQRLYDLKISHNDMKPENFIIAPQQRVWLIDLEKTHSRLPDEILKQRQLLDTQLLLNSRTWQNHPDVVDILRHELEQTQLGQQLQDALQTNTLCCSKPTAQVT